MTQNVVVITKNVVFRYTWFMFLVKNRATATISMHISPLTNLLLLKFDSQLNQRCLDFLEVVSLCSLCLVPTDFLISPEGVGFVALPLIYTSGSAF